MEPARVILVAMTPGGVIGREGKIPWNIPEELRLFRELTVGHTVLMGRRTFESIGRPLPDRKNIVLSRTLSPTPGIVVCGSLRKALAEGAAYGRKIFIIGGREVFAEALPLADLLRVSWIAREYHGDVFFPPLRLQEWEEIHAQDYPEFRHVLYGRRRGGDSGGPDAPDMT